MIVATAGHIDHGKTLLVKTLTGVDTDRLPEEKSRGISIDLGFAYLPLTNGSVIGFVDVPGHERFIRNMLAGVCGIDFALLVVAADDGIMPQTVEHLQILDLLNVGRGAAVITKIDRVESARAGQVADNVKALLSATKLANIPVLQVSAVSGAGIAELREVLERESVIESARRSIGQNFRLAIDRAFSVPGSGTVVTGTVFNGVVRTGSKLMVSPAGISVRVRGIQIRGKAADEAVAGQRCALNLTGADLESTGRGDWVLDEAIHCPTRRIDARVTILESEKGSLKHWTPVHLHLATADVTARVAIRRGAAIAPGSSAVVQFLLDQPVGALHGDRFILRDQSACRTLGGGIVVDPFAPAVRRNHRMRTAELAALEQPTAGAKLAALIALLDGGVDLARFERLLNLDHENAAALYAQADLVQTGKTMRIGIARDRHEALREGVIPNLTDFHRTQPQAVGKDIEAMRKELAGSLPLESFVSLLRGLADERKIELSGSTARLPGHNTTANPADERLWQVIRPALESAGFAPPPVKELALRVNLKEAVVKDFLHRKAKGSEVMKVTADRFYPRSTLANLAAIAQSTARSRPDGLFTAAQYRDATGIGRGLAIEVLEYLDTLGITQRTGDTRRIRKDFEPLLGPAAPVQKVQATPSAAPSKPAGPGHKRRFSNYGKR